MSFKGSPLKLKEGFTLLFYMDTNKSILCNSTSLNFHRFDNGVHRFALLSPHLCLAIKADVISKV